MSPGLKWGSFIKGCIGQVFYGTRVIIAQPNIKVITPASSFHGIITKFTERFATVHPIRTIVPAVPGSTVDGKSPRLNSTACYVLVSPDDPRACVRCQKTAHYSRPTHSGFCSAAPRHQCILCHRPGEGVYGNSYPRGRHTEECQHHIIWPFRISPRDVRSSVWGSNIPTFY